MVIYLPITYLHHVLTYYLPTYLPTFFLSTLNLLNFFIYQHSHLHIYDLPSHLLLRTPYLNINTYLPTYLTTYILPTLNLNF